MLASHGRGGAGNMSDTKNAPKVTPKDLETPTLKTSIITTGRGGSGNMAKNQDPYETRLRQDVEAVPRRPSAGATHFGRGGAANVFKGDEEAERAALATKKESAIDDTSSHNSNGSDKGVGNLAAKGKQWLFGKKA